MREPMAPLRGKLAGFADQQKIGESRRSEIGWESKYAIVIHCIRDSENAYIA